ncbi:uncharacterized protein LOC119178793 isoform X2 [Rhipicephalus microplus]|uniref:uncharacterized protein LOC119178793 isoform X2 n=1 Tax=Rhipicephalus microplus TaxID=6941 RepID=UPI003F6C69D7
MGMLKADGVHPTKHGSQLLGCLLRAAIKQASKDLEASHNGALQQQHQKEKDHKKLRFQYSDQSKGLAQYWNNCSAHVGYHLREHNKDLLPAIMSWS